MVLHCTATIEGSEVTSEQIKRWHMGAKKEKNGTVTYRGKNYPNMAALPDEYLFGKKAKETNGRGWAQVGYSDMFHLNGNVENLVPYDEDNIVEPWEITNGAFGYNSTSRHVVYVGGLDKTTKKGKDTRTTGQLESLPEYVKKTIALHPDIIVCGHYQVNPTGCPNFDVPAWLKEIGVDEKNIMKKV